MTNLLKAGLGISALALAGLAWNFIDMYNLVGRCVNVSGNCQAYSNWQSINTVGFGLLFIGLVLVTIGLINKRSN